MVILLEKIKILVIQDRSLFLFDKGQMITEKKNNVILKLVSWLIIQSYGQGTCKSQIIIGL